MEIYDPDRDWIGECERAAGHDALVRQPAGGAARLFSRYNLNSGSRLEKRMEEEVQESPKKGPSVISAIFWLRDLAVSVLLAVILIVFIYQPVKVEGTSMMPTLTDQERIFINKFTYHFGFGEVERGDMVVFWFPLDRQKSYIKRVIGIPGDMVRIDSGQVYVNGTALAED